mmetsp:Transcript_34377/g.56159  ORF Transcript_34377/g.56159 Transcript_34377/m.56159 type:complete len:234 (+) Transcript_34377:78-779(+)
MNRSRPTNMDYDEMPLEDLEASEDRDDADLWFLPGPMEDEPDYLPPGPAPEPKESDVVEAWRAAEAGQAAQLARVAARLGILDERLRRGPAGWRQRLALIEAADFSWLTQDRICLDRLSLYMALRVSTVTDDAQAFIEDPQARSNTGELRRLPGLGRAPGLDDIGFLRLRCRSGRQVIRFVLHRPWQEPEVSVIPVLGRLQVFERHLVIVHVCRARSVHARIIKLFCALDDGV